MVLHNHLPYWALSDNNSVEPGSEISNCANWDSAIDLNWIGLGGVPSSSCVWNGGTKANFRGDDETAFTAYGAPNAVFDMVEGSDSTVSITTGQSVTLTGLAVYISVGAGHKAISGDWYFTAVVNGTPTGSSCAPTGHIVDPRTGSGHVMTCDAALEVSVAEGSTISIQSYWNASRHRKDDVQGDIDWAINYSLGLPLN